MKFPIFSSNKEKKSTIFLSFQFNLPSRILVNSYEYFSFWIFHEYMKKYLLTSIVLNTVFIYYIHTNLDFFQCVEYEEIYLDACYNFTICASLFSKEKNNIYKLFFSVYLSVKIPPRLVLTKHFNGHISEQKEQDFQEKPSLYTHSP